MQPTTRPPLTTLAALALGSALALTWLALGAATALAAGSAQEQRGAELLSAVERDETSCAELDSADFGAIGEFAMARMLGSSQAHEAMDEAIAQMTGASGLARMHEAMGQRFAGCGGSGPAGSYGGMMAMAQMMGDLGGPPGIYGPAGASSDYPGLGGVMMGPDRDLGEDDDWPGAWMAIVMLALLVGVGLAVFAIARPRRQAGPTAIDVLAQRFARGDITTEDYERRRTLLEGGGR